MTPGNDSVTEHMKKFFRDYIQLKNSGNNNPKVKIAVIDTGFSENDSDPVLGALHIRNLIKERQNFFIPRDASEAEPTCVDNHGHGTHVARLLLSFAPQAELYIAKIADSKNLRSTSKNQLLAVRLSRTVDV